MTTRTLGSDERVVRSYYYPTPPDYYVTGHTISHSNCPWSLNFKYSFIDDEKFQLIFQGYVLPLGELDAVPTSHMLTSVAMSSPPKPYSHS